NLAKVLDVDVGHAWPTAHWGTPADGHRAPYITNVGFDAAGALLAHLDGATLARKGRQRKRGLIEFSQQPFLADNTASMATSGFMYVPKAAAAGEPCGVHVALHGCGQSASQVGLQFAQNTGLNEWAETNRLVVLYPQVRPSDDYTAYNPLGSWDW